MLPEFKLKLQYLMKAPTPDSGASNEAFFLALLTAGGGITGYVRSGSVPSVAAGLTVGALVCICFLPYLVLFSDLSMRVLYEGAIKSVPHIK